MRGEVEFMKAITFVRAMLAAKTKVSYSEGCSAVRIPSMFLLLNCGFML